MNEAGGPRMLPGSSTVRLALLLALSQLLTLAIGLSVMHSLTQRTLSRDAQSAAEVARDDLRAVNRDAGRPGLVAAIGDRLAAQSDDRDFVAYLRGHDGSRIAGNLAAWPQGAVPDRWQVADLTRSGASRAEHTGYIITRLPDGTELLTGEVLEQQQQLDRASEQAFAWAMLAGLVITAGASWAILRVLERRIDRFASAASAFASGQMSTRIALNPAGDAFDRLGTAINAMLERIEALVGELRAVTDSMAHDLRSPVARMRSALERSLGTVRDPAARGALGDAIDEADGLQRLLDTALEISRAEAGIGRNQFARFDLAAMLRDLAEVYGPLAEDEGFSIEVAAPPALAVNAHRELLFRAISNLIDNALKYAGGGSRIALSASSDGNKVAVIVRDDGPGIRAADRDAALRRYGRLDPARTRSGAGLGMALVETIAGLHGGGMHLGDAAPHGLEVRLDLPVAV